MTQYMIAWNLVNIFIPVKGGHLLITVDNISGEI
jgi:hypothetical protein